MVELTYWIFSILVVLEACAGKTVNNAEYEKFPTDQFWLSPKIAITNWDEAMIEEAPFLTEAEREVVIDAASYNSINPLILMAHLIQEHQSNPSFVPSTIATFDKEVNRISDSLHALFEQYEDDRSKETTVSKFAEASLSEVFSSNEKNQAVFLAKYKQLSRKYIQDTRSWGTQEEMTLSWPWPQGTRWVVGGTHSVSGKGDGIGEIMSSLDMNDVNIRCKWKENPWCVDPSTPFVHAMHDGKVTMKSKCNVRIEHPSGWATNYFHMDNQGTLSHGQKVKKGDRIGRYAGSIGVALCTPGSSSGPHVHVTLIDNKGHDSSLEGWVIGDYKVHAGRSNYCDYDTCSNCYLENISDRSTLCNKNFVEISA